MLFGGLAFVLLGLTAWALRRPRPAPVEATPARAHGFESVPTPARSTPPGFASPGVVRDADGVDHFGEYRLLELLGRGGMASVFKAERRSEVCALKRPLTAFLQEPEFLERFLREAEIGRTLNHPNIIRILERGEVEGVPFFTMELLPGETLQARLKREGALEPRTATRMVVQVAEALDYAHNKGVVHRDLKPSNVMVLADGTAKVMDFGIARARRFEGLTVTGSGRAQRSLLAGGGLLRDPHRRPAFHRGHALRHPAQAPHRGSPAPHPPPARAAVRSGADRAAAPRQAARGPLRGGRGAGPRAARLPQPSLITSVEASASAARG
ncbi:MAG: hypothetical protein DMF79_08755 [Acidobacteria bacterium]|nr:MAG: hypothetical protein DMF79_08755 [Acidobacteriota bacterium]